MSQRYRKGVLNRDNDPTEVWQEGPPQFHGSCMGVDIRSRGGDVKDHAMVVMYVEDDEIWHEKESFSSYWLDEQIRVLQEAKAYLDANYDKGKWGYERRNSE